MAQDPETGTAFLAKNKQIDGLYPSLGEMAYHLVYMIPADAGEKEMVNFLAGDLSNATYQMIQIHLLQEKPLTFSLQALTDPEKYEVVYLYGTENNRLCCTRPQPLTWYNQEDSNR